MSNAIIFARLPYPTAARDAAFTAAAALTGASFDAAQTFDNLLDAADRLLVLFRETILGLVLSTQTHTEVVQSSLDKLMPDEFENGAECFDTLLKLLDFRAHPTKHPKPRSLVRALLQQGPAKGSIALSASACQQASVACARATSRGPTPARCR